MSAPSPLPSPRPLEQRLAKLQGQREALEKGLEQNRRDQEELQQKIDLAKSVEEALELLSGQLFEDLLKQLELQLSLALQDVLEQPLQVKTQTTTKRGAINIEFMIERGGELEDIMLGQGGSVANVLSVGLRMFALAGLKDRHRQLLVLDEPDCWLQPDLVPKLVHIIKLAGQQLGIQVILISHHQADYFAAAADRMYRLLPGPDGVRVEVIKKEEQ
jgi:DNA repair exonuclease SbcCD ATPase subunit